MNSNNPTITPLLRWVAALESIVLIFAGGGLFLSPQVYDSLWPWSLTPFNARLLGAIYLTALVSNALMVYYGRWSPARIVLPLTFLFTFIVLLVSLIYLDQFTVTGSTIFWLLLYAGLVVNSAYHLWLYRSLPPAPPAEVSATLRVYLRAFAGVVGIYGIGLLVVPVFFTAFWPWAIDEFHGRMYSVAFLTPALGAWMLAQSATRIDFQVLGWAQVAGGILPIIGALIVNSTVPPERQMDWSQAGTWLWIAIALSLLLTGIAMLWQMQRIRSDVNQS